MLAAPKRWHACGSDRVCIISLIACMPPPQVRHGRHGLQVEAESKEMMPTPVPSTTPSLWVPAGHTYTHTHMERTRTRRLPQAAHPDQRDEQPLSALPYTPSLWSPQIEAGADAAEATPSLYWADYLGNCRKVRGGGAHHGHARTHTHTHKTRVHRQTRMPTSATAARCADTTQRCTHRHTHTGLVSTEKTHGA